MARKALKASAVSMTPAAWCDKLASVVVTSKAQIAEAEALLNARKGAKLAALQAALVGCEAVNEDAWKTAWAKPMETALVKAGYADMSARSEASMLKVVVIALTNGRAPTAEHGSPRAFADFIREDIAKAGLITPGTPRAPRAGKATAPTTKPGTPAGPATSLNDAQIARALFAKIGQNPTQDQLDLLVRMIRQNPAKFWTKITALAQGN